MLSGWTGAGGQAYIEQVDKLGKDVSLLNQDIYEVGLALHRLANGLAENLKKVPIPTNNNYGGAGVYRLINGTELDVADLSFDVVRRQLNEDININQNNYNDGNFLNANKYGQDLRAESDSTLHTKNLSSDAIQKWYNECTIAARAAASACVTVVQDEYTRLLINPLPQGPNATVSDEAADPDADYNVDTSSSGTNTGNADLSNIAADASSAGWSATTASAGTTDAYDTSAYDTSAYDSAYATGSDSDYDTAYGTSDAESSLAGVDSSGLSSVTASGGTGSLGTGSVGSSGTGSTYATTSTGSGSSSESGTSALTTPTSALGASAAAGTAASTKSTTSGMMGGAGMGAGMGAGANAGGDRRTPLIEDNDPWGLDDDLPTGLLG